jgi:hypothetical protein
VNRDEEIVKLKLLAEVNKVAAKNRPNPPNAIL